MNKKSTQTKAKKKTKVLDEVNVAEISELVQASGMSLRALAKQVGVEHSNFQKRLKGEFRIAPKEVSKLAKALEVSQSTILRLFMGLKEDSNPNRKTVPVEGWLDGSLIMRVEGLKGRRSIFKSLRGKYAALRFQTAGTEYASLDGKIFLYKTVGRSDFKESGVGQIALVKIEGDELLRLREIKKSQAGLYDLWTFFGSRLIESGVTIEEFYPMVGIENELLSD